MSQQEKHQKYELYIGHRKSRSLAQPLRVGSVRYDDQERLYILRLSHIPTCYFMQRNREDDSAFTVYARKLPKEEGFRYLDPIGKGALTSDLKDYMEIVIPMLPRKLYMSLYPAAQNQF